jgi:hypothetical protein
LNTSRFLQIAILPACGLQLNAADAGVTLAARPASYPAQKAGISTIWCVMLQHLDRSPEEKAAYIGLRELPDEEFAAHYLAIG